jgi:rhodanese-related sulfurtransferase
MTVQNLAWVLLAVVVAWMLYGRLAGKAAPGDVHAAVAAGARLVDVRSPAEFASGHLDGAINLPVDELPARAGEIGPADTSVVVYCRSGARSARAAGILREKGYSRVLDLGAMSRW